MQAINNNKPIIYSNELTKEFIESIILDDSKLNKIKLNEFKLDEKLLDGGLMGDICRIHLKWEQGNEDCPSSTLPNSIIMKSIKKTKESFEFSFTRKTYREVDFYINQMVKVNGGVTNKMVYNFIPIVYYAEKTEIGEYCIIMQDLSDSKYEYVSACKAMGNQCWGGITSEFGLEFYNSFEIVNNCFSKIAEIHIDNWRNHSNNLFNESNSWLKNFETYQNQGKDKWIQDNVIQLKSIWDQTTLPLIEKFKSSSSLLNVDQTLQVVDLYFNNYLIWENYQKRIDIKNESTPFTLVHGDFHAGNIMIPKVTSKDQQQSNDSDNVIILDWSEYGIGDPFTECSQFIISNCSIEFRRENEEKLFKLYWEKLIKSEKVDANHFTFENCYNFYKRGGIDKWIMINTMMSSMGLPDFAFIYFFNQLSTFIQDHFKNELFILKK